MDPARVSKSSFYNEYFGHKVSDLTTIHRHLRQNHRQMIYLAGDSSMDNKYWFTEEGRAVNGYETVLEPPISKQDIAYWMNREIVKRNFSNQYAAINCAVEHATIGSKCCGLSPQDEFLRNHIDTNDVLVISIGGNDVALAPAPCTIVSMLSLLCCTTTDCINNYSCGCALPVDDYCKGCACGAASNLCACPPGLGYFVHLFGTRIQHIVDRLTSIKRPKLIVVCMIYFLDEHPTASWANTVLSILGYDSNPLKLQTVIKQVFRLATQKIRISGSEVLALPLFECLNGKHSADYCARVEPSAVGGEKLASFILEAILRHEGSYQSPRMWLLLLSYHIHIIYLSFCW